MKYKIIKGVKCRRLKLDEMRRRGDLFEREEGNWMTTSDYGSRIHIYHPAYYRPIRPAKKAQEPKAWKAWFDPSTFNCFEDQPSNADLRANGCIRVEIRPIKGTK